MLKLDKTEFFRRLQESLSAHDGLIAGFRVRSLAVKGAEGWENMWCSIVAIVDDSAISSEAKTLEYRDVLLVDEWIDRARLVMLMNDALAGKFTVSGRELLTSDLRDFMFDPQLASPYSSPYYSFSLQSLGRRREGSGTRLLEPGLPYFPDRFEALLWWCEPREFHGVRDARFGFVELEVPNCRGLIRRMVRQDASILVNVAGMPGVLGTARVQGAWWGERGPNHFEIQGLAADAPTRIEIPADAERLDLFLVAADNEILDSHREGHGLRPPRPSVLRPEPTGILRAVQEAIRSGEGQQVEFKPYIRRGDGKSREVIATAVAFANTKGGLLLVGVDDRCIPIGVDRELTEVARKAHRTLEEELRDYCGYLKQQIAGGTNRSPRLDVTPVQLESHTIVVVRVLPGPQTPYALGNDVFVRRGANTVKADPDTDLPRLLHGRADSDSFGG